MCERTAIQIAICEFQERAKSPEPQGVEMTKIVSALGLMIALSLGAIALFQPGLNEVMAQGAQPDVCSVSAFDEGYGVQSPASRAECVAAR